VKKQDLPQGTIQGMTKVLKELASNKEELKDDDQANAKSQKLLNSRTNSKTQVICQFFFVTAIFISFYAVNFNLEVLYLQNIKNIY
jgi:hypothetical protein